MENPATWGKAEHVIIQALDEYDKDVLGNRGVIVGLSLTRRIADALRNANLLREPEE